MYEYDERNRVVRAVTTRESEWDTEQQAIMLALEVYRASLCRRCGGELAETTNPLHDADNPHGTHVYRRVKLLRCHRCTASMESEAQHSGNHLVKHPAAVQHHIELQPRLQRRR